jgi:UDP-glucuronate 4-epimerase
MLFFRRPAWAIILFLQIPGARVNDSKVLVTGAAGFIGFHLCLRLLEAGRQVAGVDNLCPYYDLALKEARLSQLKAFPGFRFHEKNIEDREALPAIFAELKPAVVLNLAAQAGVRYSVTHPFTYVDSNLSGFANILECCRNFGVAQLLYASSSSVYGFQAKQPFEVGANTDHPISLYAATKKANEVMAHSYSHLYGLPCTGLRFFTVYGPWGRPDMALFKFTKAILAGEEIEVYGEGKQTRDFTYVDDVVEALLRVMQKPEAVTALSPPYKIHNVGNGSPVPLMDFIRAIEAALGKKAQIKMLPMQPGDVSSTYADTSELAKDYDFRPKMPIAEGVAKFVQWYRSFYHA